MLQIYCIFTVLMRNSDFGGSEIGIPRQHSKTCNRLENHWTKWWIGWFKCSQDMAILRLCGPIAGGEVSSLLGTSVCCSLRASSRQSLHTAMFEYQRVWGFGNSHPHFLLEDIYIYIYIHNNTYTYIYNTLYIYIVIINMSSNNMTLGSRPWDAAYLPAPFHSGHFFWGEMIIQIGRNPSGHAQGGAVSAGQKSMVRECWNHRESNLL